MEAKIENILQNIGLSSEEVIHHDGPVFANVFPGIDNATAKWIDEQLDWEDAVSLVFLAVHQYSKALQLGRVIEANKRNVINIQDENPIGIVQVMNLSAQKLGLGAVSWQIRVYEALFLIGNKKLLFDLGVDDEDAERKFRGGLQIKAERRILFKLCQELEINDQARLVKLFKDKIGFLPPVTMMETQFLHLIVKSTPGPICQYVKSCLQLIQSAHLLNIFEQDSCGNRSCKAHIRSPGQGEEYYEQGPGLCVIINQKLFYADPRYPGVGKQEDRLGTDRDRDELEVTFTLFGAVCLIFNDLTHEEIINKLEKAAIKANDQNYCWVAVCVLSHGQRVNGVDEIFGCNGVGVERKKIVGMFADASKCPNLQKKPKLFFFQACRGNESTVAAARANIASDSPVPTIKGWPSISDYMIASATIEDFVSYRSTTDGSFFIRNLCDELQKHGHEKSLSDVMTCVNRKVAGYRPDFPSMPEYTSTMSKKFQFRRTKESIINGLEKKAKNGLFYQLQNEFIADKINRGINC